MDSLKGLVAGQGCTPAGVAAAANPLSSMVSGLANTMPGGAIVGTGGPAGGGATYDMAGAGAHPDDFAAHAHARARVARAQQARAMAMHGGGGGGGGGAAGMAAAWRGAKQGSQRQLAAGGGDGAPHGAMEAAWRGRSAAPPQPGAFARGAPGVPAQQRGGMMHRMGGLMHGGMMQHMGGPMHGGMMQHMGGPMHGGMMQHMASSTMMARPPMARTAQPQQTAAVAASAPEAVAAPAPTAAATSEWAAALPADSTQTTNAATREGAAVASRGEDEEAALARDASRALAQTLAQDPTFKDSGLAEFMTKLADGAVEIQDNSVVPGASPQISIVGETTGASTATASGAGATGRMQAAWDSAHGGDEIDFGTMLAGMETASPEEQAWWTGGGISEAMASQWVQPAEARQYTLGDRDANPFADAASPFDLGMKLFNQGKLHEAVHAFEAVVLKEKEHSEAWRMLGMCHAENDEDKKAILCLERAVEEDPYNLDAQVALGVSYVNELKYDKALAALKSWITHNPKFHGLKVSGPEEVDDAYGAPDSKLDDVMHLMLKATAWDSTDPEVQIVLGVLYNVSRDYDSAIAAFQQALDAKPDDYSLWNKLGATRANSSRSEQAVPAYRRALELKPSYARGWLNLGISHANLGHYRDAAKAYMAALKLNPGAEHIWTYLRIALTCLKRFDLVELTQREDVSEFASFDL